MMRGGSLKWNIEATYLLGLDLLNGFDPDRKEEGQKLLTQIADQGYIKAQTTLAEHYYIQWNRQYNQIKNSSSIFSDVLQLQANMAFETKKISPILDLALKYYSLAATQGDAEALWCRANIQFTFSNALDVQRFALSLMEKAARKGHLPAINYLTEMGKWSLRSSHCKFVVRICTGSEIINKEWSYI